MKPSISRRRAVAAAAAGIASFNVLRVPVRAAQFNYKYANNNPVETPINVRLTQMWAAVERETGGRLSVKMFPNSVLGGESSMLTQLRSGALEFFSTSGQPLSVVVPSAAIGGMPFAFRSRERLYAAIDGELGSHIRSEIEAKGLHVFNRPFEVGFYQITNSLRPVRTVADLAGMKMRTGDSRLAVDMFRSLGASPTPFNIYEAYSALQTHIVDGQFNPYQLIEVFKYYEVQRYLTEINMTFENWWFMANRSAWEALPPDIQAVVARNADKYVMLQRRDTALFARASADKLVRQGMIRNVADPASFRARLSEGFYQRWKAEFGAGAWAILEQYAGKLA